MKIRLLALISSLVVPIALLPIACSKDDGGKKKETGISTGTGTGTGVNTGTTTTPVGEGVGGVTPSTVDVWNTAAIAACNGIASETENMPAKIEMVVDVSSSMTQTTNGSQQTKWEQTKEALVAGFVGNGAGATGLPDSVAVGLLFYPNVQREERTLTQTADVTTCVNTAAAIPMAVLGPDTAGSQRQTIRDTLNTFVLDKSGTPTWDAMNYAGYTELLDKAASVDGKPYLVLITDGMPTMSGQCTNPSGRFSDVDPQPIVDLIEKLNTEDGVKTFLIGSPGSENGRAWMSQAAVLGGTATPGCDEAGPNWCHMDLTESDDFGAALTNALTTIAGAVASCDYTILELGVDGEKIDPNLTVVLAKYSDGTVEMINRDDTPEDCDVGWYVNTTTNQVVFCGDTCGKVQADAQVQLQVLFGCSEEDVTVLQ